MFSIIIPLFVQPNDPIGKYVHLLCNVLANPTQDHLSFATALFPRKTDVMDFYELEHLVPSNKVLKKEDRYVVMSIILTRFTMGGRSIAQVPFQVHHVKNTTGCPRKKYLSEISGFGPKWSRACARDP